MMMNIMSVSSSTWNGVSQTYDSVLSHVCSQSMRLVNGACAVCARNIISSSGTRAAPSCCLPCIWHWHKDWLRPILEQNNSGQDDMTLFCALHFLLGASSCLAQTACGLLERHHRLHCTCVCIVLIVLRLVTLKAAKDTMMPWEDVSSLSNRA